MGSDRPRLGFLGIGVLGAAMVERLLARGYQVTAWNRSPERLAAVTALGAVAAETPAAVAAASDIVMLCVLDGAAVEEVCFGPGGVAEAQDGGRDAGRFLDHPAGSYGRPRPAPECSDRRRLDRRAGFGRAAGCPRRQAHHHGRRNRRRQSRARRPVLAEVASNVTHLGPVGAGQTAKVLNQAIVGVSYLLMTEVLALAEATDVDPALLPKALSGGLADSTILQRIYPLMQAEDFSRPLGFARQLNKDLQALGAFAEAHGVRAAGDRRGDHSLCRIYAGRQRHGRQRLGVASLSAQEAVAYLPVHSGGILSRNARTPRRKSSLP